MLTIQKLKTAFCFVSRPDDGVIYLSHTFDLGIRAGRVGELIDDARARCDFVVLASLTSALA